MHTRLFNLLLMSILWFRPYRAIQHECLSDGIAEDCCHFRPFEPDAAAVFANDHDDAIDLAGLSWIDIESVVFLECGVKELPTIGVPVRRIISQTFPGLFHTLLEQELVL
jgi:hypothetical protein